MLRPLYFSLGLVMVVLGVIGIFVPLMPTTTFLILAAWCFARSSRRAENWLLSHPKLGPIVVAWRQTGAIAPRHKLYSIGGMTLGFTIFMLTAQPVWWLALVVAMLLLSCAAFVVTRPSFTGKTPSSSAG